MWDFIVSKINILILVREPAIIFIPHRQTSLMAYNTIRNNLPSSKTKVFCLTYNYDKYVHRTITSKCGKIAGNFILSNGHEW